MSSNIAQNYPCGSETEAERAAAVAAAFAAFEGLESTVAAASDPLGPAEPSEPGQPQRWWIFVCPKDDFRGRLHVAGYARERHALYTVCDTCGSTFLR